MTEKTNKPRVLITYVEAGMGHIVSAAAISEVLTRKYGDKLEIIDCHILRDSDNPILPKYEKFLVENTKKYSSNPILGDLQFGSMHLIGAQNSLKFVHDVVFMRQTNATIEEYKKYKPDLILCTHYFLLYTANEYKKKYDPDVTVVAYCPDNNVHGWWDIRTDCLYTNNPLATKQAYNLNFGNGCVREVFYPTRKDVVAANESKEYYREQFGIPKDKFAVVVADGVYAKAKLKRICLSLLKTDVPLTICVLAGKNTELKEKFDALKPNVNPNITLLTFGFLQNAPELYCACDLFVTKAGPNAVLDSVMMGTPVLISYCASPIERWTQRLFVDLMACGYYIETPYLIRKQVEELALHPELLDEARSQLGYFDKNKNGAEEIADDIVQILWNKHVRKKNILSEEEQAIDALFAEKVKKKRAAAEEKLAKLTSKNAKRLDAVLAAAETDRITVVSREREERALRRLEKKINQLNAAADLSAERIKKRTEKEVQRTEEKAKKAKKSVYDDHTSRYTKRVASEKTKNMGVKSEE